MLKMAVLAPMPSASARTTTSANPGLRRSARRAYFRSWANSDMAGVLSDSVVRLLLAAVVGHHRRVHRVCARLGEHHHPAQRAWRLGQLIGGVQRQLDAAGR